MKRNNAKSVKKKEYNNTKLKDGQRKRKLKPKPKIKYKTILLEEE